tara:strand:+ start:7023 stop:7139 length:117 start_codon:yes stop_codon:yes gene_type:complete
MFEATTNPAVRNAMQKAHAERGAAMAALWGWLRHPTFR